MQQKVEWVREGATAAGRDPDTLELEMNHWLARVTDEAGRPTRTCPACAARYGVEPALLAESPSVLVGTVEQCIETLQARRERFGFSVLQLDAGFPNPGLHDFAPVIAALSGI